MSKREYLFRALLDWKKLIQKLQEAADISISTIRRASAWCGGLSTLGNLDNKYDLLTGNGTAAGAANGKKLSTVISHIASNWEATSKAIINALKVGELLIDQHVIFQTINAQAFLTGGNGLHGRKAPAGGRVQSRTDVPHGPIAYPFGCQAGMGYRCGAWMKDAMSANGNIHIRGGQNGQPAVAAGYYYGWDREKCKVLLVILCNWTCLGEWFS